MRGSQARPDTPTSPVVSAEWLTKATRWPSRENEKPETAARSGALTRSIPSEAGSSRKRCPAVFCEAENQIPSPFQATA